ncbi:hypothetical protein [Psychromonas algicola]|uniref:hypothetical protein n=1 Tax=Psychromonas algicola TaxID=2555642 RepID=UPI0010686E7C|nr:hypothetical protein [Psychromonas sp. RZ5]TEW51679.1 hypothetical protein E2R67_06805 [Psychromonas sp. RZ5]
MESPEQLVRSFIVDYKIWNDESIIIDQRDEIKGMDIAEDNYKLLIEKYCLPSVVPQGVAYASDSAHCLDEEVILQVIIDNNKATVITQHTDADDFISDYEYHLTLTDNGWKLLSLLYVDEDEKLESL